MHFISPMMPSKNTPCACWLLRSTSPKSTAQCLHGPSPDLRDWHLALWLQRPSVDFDHLGQDHEQNSGVFGQNDRHADAGLCHQRRDRRSHPGCAICLSISQRSRSTDGPLIGKTLELVFFLWLVFVAQATLTFGQADPVSNHLSGLGHLSSIDISIRFPNYCPNMGILT